MQFVAEYAESTCETYCRKYLHLDLDSQYLKCQPVVGSTVVQDLNKASILDDGKGHCLATAYTLESTDVFKLLS